MNLNCIISEMKENYNLKIPYDVDSNNKRYNEENRKVFIFIVYMI